MKIQGQRAKGYLITISGVALISPDGLLTRLITADALTISFWRGLLFGLSAMLIVLVRYRKQAFHLLTHHTKQDYGVMVTYCISNLCFIYAFTHTSIANALFMLSTTSIWAALIGWLFLKERVPLRTWCAISMVIIGIIVITRGSHDGVSSWDGDLAGLMAALVLAAQFALIRSTKTPDALPAVGLGGLLAAVMLIPFVSPTTTSSNDLMYLFIMGVIMLPIANILLNLGPKYLPAPEVGLMTLLETILGPLWVWIVLSENPGTYSLIGGVIVLIALIINAYLSIKEQRQRIT